MGSHITLEASDGHRLAAYRADPRGGPRGGIIVIQEVFGLNEHVQGVCDSYAADGYAVIAPALFDRVERGVELGYEGEDLTRGREISSALGWDEPLLDIQAAVDSVKQVGKVAVIGYCWGGSLAWLCATRLDVDAAVCYYGRLIADFVDELPKCPVMLHFGEKDAFIPNDKVEIVRSRHPDQSLFTYPAGHGFNCEARADYHEESARLARARTLEFLKEHVG